MPKYNVWLYTEVAVKVASVEAATPVEAALNTEGQVLGEMHDLIDRSCRVPLGNGTIELVEHADGVATCFLVDPLDEAGEVDADGSQWLASDGTPLSRQRRREEAVRDLLKRIAALDLPETADLSAKARELLA